ncbi:hypothetical protein [Streptomyces rubellomurinus]|uniref:hypothetical protein n=1 Tax=Streptomyces rubellomurinus (strain ATCC 31215) TaxID=359131 RepID=UPI000AA536F7|nr:hypothetical protein [Streptomyces rubellomurinus]
MLTAIRGTGTAPAFLRLPPRRLVAPLLDHVVRPGAGADAELRAFFGAADEDRAR